jgi:rRNA-processing protein FCF1
MKLIVTDANILIYLSRLDLIESFFNMNFSVHTTDFIIDEYYRGKKKEKNLKNINKYMRSGKIEVHVYDYNKIFTLHEQKKSLTASDCSIYILSREIKAILLTGDRKLKLFSEKGDVEVHGIIWLIDKCITMVLLTISSIKKSSLS